MAKKSSLLVLFLTAVLLLFISEEKLTAQTGNPAPNKGSAGSQPASKTAVQTTGAQPNPAAGPEALKNVLGAMDRAAARFTTAETNFVWDQYTQVVNEHDLQSGVMYIRKRGPKDVEMAAEIWPGPLKPKRSEPADKYVLYVNQEVQLYQPGIDQVTKYNAGKNKQAFESFLVLGFGGSGQDLLSSFEVAYEGDEVLDGIRTARLKLTPRSPAVRNMFNPIWLWIDPKRGVSLQQKFAEPNSGDYRLARYSDIQLEKAIPENVFKLKTTKKTRVVSPGS